MKRIISILISIFMVLELTSCTFVTTGPVSDTKFALDTFIKITLYDSRDTELIDECFSLCEHYEDIFSADLEGSELYLLNRAALDAEKNGEQMIDYVISEDLYRLISLAYGFKDFTESRYDISKRSVFKLWDFHDGSNRIPSKDEIGTALSDSAEGLFTLTKGSDGAYRISSDSERMPQFDLGSCAKGYIADRIKEYLVSKGVTSALIDLGGNIQCVGKKCDADLLGRKRYDFTIGVLVPFSKDDSVSFKVSIDDMSVVTSGIYQRYFISEDRLYHHIIDAVTGYPAESELASVTVIGEDSALCDVLSTVFYLVGEERAKEMLKEYDNMYAAFIYRDGSSSYSENFEKLMIN